MYKFNLVQVLENRFLTKLVETFKQNEATRFERLGKYYMGENETIRFRKMDVTKPNNKISHGFARYITNMATSYFLGKPVRYHVDEDEEFQEVLNDYLDDTYNQHYEVAKEMSKTGVAYELLYINESGQLKSKKYNAGEWIPVYSVDPDEFLECAIHIWSVFDLEGKALYEHADVYDKEQIRHYIREARHGEVFQLSGSEPHFLSDVPVIVYWNNEEQLGDYEPVIPLIDAYDRAQSDTANDMDYFTDAYLAIVGASGGFMDADGNEISHHEAGQSLRNNRVLFLDEKGNAFFLTKEGNDSANEHYKSRLFKDLFFTSQVPPMTDESFAGDLSGIAIRYKLIGLEQLAIMKENKFRLAQQKKLKIMTDHINLREQKQFDASKIRQIYERNFIDNTKEMIENAARLEGMVSRETQLSTLPSGIVDNPMLELKRMEEETKAGEGLFMEEME